MFGDVLKKLRKKAKLTQDELAKSIDMSKSSISMYENNNREPDFETLEIFADFFNVDMNTLHGKSSLPTYPNIFPIKAQRIPLLRNIACGVPVFADEDKESYVLVGTDIKADFCLKAKGDSMINARIQDGDIVFIRKQNTVENGEIAAVIIVDEATLKRVYYYPKTNKLVLQSENPRYPPFVYSDNELEQINIIGKAIAFQSDL